MPRRLWATVQLEERLPKRKQEDVGGVYTVIVTGHVDFRSHLHTMELAKSPSVDTEEDERALIHVLCHCPVSTAKRRVRTSWKHVTSSMEFTIILTL